MECDRIITRRHVTLAKRAGRALVACWLLAGSVAAESPASDDPPVSDAELFEMCCWATGRSGFNHCSEYGICVDGADRICLGRGPAEGWRRPCDKPAEPPGEPGVSR